MLVVLGCLVWRNAERFDSGSLIYILSQISDIPNIYTRCVGWKINMFGVALSYSSVQENCLINQAQVEAARVFANLYIYLLKNIKYIVCLRSKLVASELRNLYSDAIMVTRQGFGR